MSSFSSPASSYGEKILQRVIQPLYVGSTPAIWKSWFIKSFFLSAPLNRRSMNILPKLPVIAPSSSTKYDLGSKGLGGGIFLRIFSRIKEFHALESGSTFVLSGDLFHSSKPKNNNYYQRRALSKKILNFSPSLF